jgi:hypothetical protein
VNVERKPATRRTHQTRLKYVQLHGARNVALQLGLLGRNLRLIGVLEVSQFGGVALHVG